MIKTIYLAGGCFWGTEHYMRQFDGVTETSTGYANGNIPNPSYEQVYTDETGYVECVEVVFDSCMISLETLCRLFFKSINPLLKNRQGNDIGTRYRTGIYWIEEADRYVIEMVYGEIQERLGTPLAVETGPLECFYPAEDYHQDYLVKNPTGYCHITPSMLRFAKRYTGITRVLRKNQTKSSPII